MAVSIGWWLMGAAPAQGEKVGDMEQKFLQQAASDGIAEVQLGNLAVGRAANPEVQRFGQRMVSDHTKANQELMALAQAKHVSVPTDTDKKHQETAQALSKLQGAGFDREFMHHMVSDHEKAVQQFLTMAQNGKDADVKAFAAKTLPVLQEHLRLAQTLAQQQGVSQAR
jgi:putative membrane protein